MGLHMLEIAEAVTGISPFLHLAIEETGDTAIFHYISLALQHLLARLQLHGAKTVLIKIIGIYLIDTQGSITISSPTTAEVKFIVDSANTVATREHQSQGIVLTITGIRKLNLTDQWGKKGTRSAQSIDTQSIITAIIFGPLLMVYQSRRQCIEIEIAHAIRADHHGSLLLMEGIYYLLQRLRGRIEVITIQLDGKLTTMVAVDSHIPAATNAKVVAIWHNLDKASCLLIIPFLHLMGNL